MAVKIILFDRLGFVKHPVKFPRLEVDIGKTALFGINLVQNGLGDNHTIGPFFRKLKDTENVIQYHRRIYDICLVLTH